MASIVNVLPRQVAEAAVASFLSLFWVGLLGLYSLPGGETQRATTLSEAIARIWLLAV